MGGLSVCDGDRLGRLLFHSHSGPESSQSEVSVDFFPPQCVLVVCIGNNLVIRYDTGAIIRYIAIYWFLHQWKCSSPKSLFVCFFRSVKDFLSVVRKMDVNLDTITTKVNAAMTRLEKKYDVTLALYQRFEKWVTTAVLTIQEFVVVCTLKKHGSLYKYKYI